MAVSKFTKFFYATVIFQKRQSVVYNSTLLTLKTKLKINKQTKMLVEIINNKNYKKSKKRPIIIK